MKKSPIFPRRSAGGFSPAARVICRAFLAMAAAVIAPAIASASSWVSARQHDGIVYFLMESPAGIGRFDLTKGEWLDRFDLPEAPVAFAVDDDGFYIGLQRRVARLDLDGEDLVHVQNTTDDVANVFSVDDFFYFDYRIGTYDAPMVSIRKSDNAAVDQNVYRRPLQGMTVARSRWTAIGRNTGVSPSDIERIVLNPDGTLGNRADSPYHGSYPRATRTYMFPDERKVVDDAGIVYSVANLTYLGSFGGGFLDLAFHGEDIPIVLREGKLYSYTNSLLESGSASLSFPAERVFVHAGTAFLFASGDDEEILVETLSLEEINAPEPGLSFNPYGIAYSPENAFLDNDGILNLYSEEHIALFRWSLAEGRYVDSIPLHGTPTHVAYSPHFHRVYLGYASGVINQIQLGGETFEEVGFVNMPQRVLGLAAADEFIFAADPSGAWNSQYVYSESGELLSSMDWTYTAQEYIWSEESRRIYSYTHHSPRDLYWQEISETGILGDRQRSPYHSSAGWTYPIRVSPGGSAVIVGSGRVHDGTSLAHVGNLANDVVDVDWIGQTVYSLKALEGVTEIQKWGQDYVLEASLEIEGTPLRLWVRNRQIIVLVEHTGQPRVVRLSSGLEMISESEVNLPPESIALSNGIVIDGSPEGTVVGRFSTEDPNEDDVHTYSLETANDLFVIVGDELRLARQVTMQDRPDFHMVTVSSRDPYGLSVEATFIVEVVPAEEPELETIDPFGMPFVPDAVVWGIDDVAYLYSAAHESVFRWSLAEGRYLESIRLFGAPDFMTYASGNHTLYFGYGSARKITQVILGEEDFDERPFALSPGQVRSIAGVGDHLLVVDPMGSWQTHYTYGADGGLIDRRDWNYYSREFTWNEVNRRVYFFRDGSSPNDILWQEIHPDGTIGSRIDSPYHSSAGIQLPIRAKPDGSVVILGSGRVYEAITLEHIDDLSNSIADATWKGDRLYTIRVGENLVQEWDDDYLLLGEAEIPGLKRVWTVGGQLVAMGENHGQPVFFFFNDDLEISSQSDINHPPEGIELSNAEIEENSPAETVVGRFSTIDPDPEDFHEYSLLTSSGFFEIVGNELRLKVSPDFETDPVFHTLRVRSTDPYGMNVERTFTIEILDVNEPPTDIIISNDFVVEQSPAGTQVGLLTAVDPDHGDSHVFELLDDGGGRFILDDYRLKIARSFTLEEGDSHEVTVRATDSGGLSVDVALSIEVRPLPVWTVSVAAGPGGAVTIVPESSEIRDGESVTLEATPNEGFAFSHWSGVSGVDNPLEIQVFEDLEIIGHFDDVEAPRIVIDEPVSGTVSDERAVFSGHVTDNTQVVATEWSFNGEGMGPLELDEEGFFIEGGITLVYGENVFEVRSEDSSGNVAEKTRVVVWEPVRTISLAVPERVPEGQIVEIEVRMDSNGLVGGINLLVEYDSAFLRALDLVWDPEMEGAFTQFNLAQEGRVAATFSLPATTVPAGEHAIARIIFRARSVPEDVVTALALAAVDVSDSTGAALNFGTFQRGGHLIVERRRFLGDINNNGILDVGDATMMQRLLVGLEEVRSWDVWLNDLNQNEALDSGDVIRVLRVAAGIDPQPGMDTDGDLQIIAGDSISGDAAASQPAANQTHGELLFSQARYVVQEGEILHVQLTLDGVDRKIAGASFSLHYPVEALRLEGSIGHRTGGLIPLGGDERAVSVWNVAPAQNDFENQTGVVRLASSSAKHWPSQNGVLADFYFHVQPGINVGDWMMRLSNAYVTTQDGDLLPLSVPEFSALGTDDEPRPSFDTWRHEHLVGHSNRIEYYESAFGNGVPNLVTYALGLPPRESNVDRLPRKSLVTVEQGDFMHRYLALTFDAPAGLADVVLRVEVSADLHDWRVLPWSDDLVDEESLDEDVVRYTVRDDTPLGEGIRARYLRLRVDRAFD